MRHPSRFLHAAALLAAGVLWTSAAFAQWQWQDDTGRNIYSDKPPPPSIPESKIIHGADGRPYMPASKVAKMRADVAPTYGFVEAKPAPAAASAAAAAKPNASASNAAANKKQEQEKKAKAEQAAKEAQAKQEEQAKMAANCSILKNNLAAVDSGQRISTLDGQGNRTVMDDAKRNSERQRLQGLMQDNKCN